MKFPDDFRWRNAPNGYATSDGQPYGVFIVPGRYAKGRVLRIIASDGAETGWDHVSVSIVDSNKCPSWDEMCLVKSLFWEPSETAIQFHPPESEHVNNHAGCLHLWRNVRQEIPLPDSILVGVKGLTFA